MIIAPPGPLEICALYSNIVAYCSSLIFIYGEIYSITKFSTIIIEIEITNTKETAHSFVNFLSLGPDLKSLKHLLYVFVS